MEKVALRTRQLLFLLFLFLFPLQLLAGEKVLFNQEVVALRSDFKELHFLVPEGKKWEFQGEFKSVGGMKDDITFHALDQANYVKWFSHYAHKTEFQLLKKQEGKFSFSAKPGETYYFVFDNFFSSVSNKKVHFTLKLVSQ